MRRTPSNPALLELRPDRAFVLHLDTRAYPLGRVVARVDHVASKRAFLTDVLRDEALGD